MSDRIGVVEVPNSFFAIILTGESVNGESLLLYKFIILFLINQFLCCGKFYGTKLFYRIEKGNYFG